MAAASGQLGERAQNLYQDMAARGTIKKNAEARPQQKPKPASPPPNTADAGSEALPKATWQRVGQKTAEITLTTATKRRYRAEGQSLDRLLAAAASTGRLGDPNRLSTAPVDEGVDLGTMADGRRHAVKQDGTAAAASTPVGAENRRDHPHSHNQPPLPGRRHPSHTPCAPPPKHSAHSTAAPECSPTTPLNQPNRQPASTRRPPAGSTPDSESPLVETTRPSKR